MYITPANNPVLEQLEVVSVIAECSARDLELPPVTPLNDIANENRRNLTMHAARLIPLFEITTYERQLILANVHRDAVQNLMTLQMSEGY